MFKKLFDPSYKELLKCQKIAKSVIDLENEYASLSDDELKNKTQIFKDRLNAGESLDDIMVESFATAREAAFRVLGLKAFEVQIVGAAVMHFGNISEMKTGEGKTLTSVLAVYLNALSGKGAHVVTVNEYLAERDSREMGAVHNFLGLTVGLNIRVLTKPEKKAAYDCDVTYSTNNELGFDYLRDNMVIYKEDRVQRDLNFAVVDEVDSILIDEARTPLIISGGQKGGANLYTQANTLVRGLTADDEYEVDVKDKHVSLTEEGIERAQRFFGIDNLYDVKYVDIVHHINNALKANYTMDKDVDYVVQEGKVIIVDQFTGRLMIGRQFSDGLHQAIEAKEKVEIKKETRTLATITFQNFFRMYAKLAGMTGTAKTEEEEFRNIYNMIVVEIPTNKPVIREDCTDLIYMTMEGKYKAIAKDIKERYTKGQPVLVGTVAIETSELLSNLLRKHGVPHNVLNAKQHEREAEIILNAGQRGAVTIATNMAGRGTDIKLGEGVVELGGLAVIGTERHESRRIDNQLRGRSGRQGDPGYTRFYLSVEDELMIRFGSDRIKSMLGRIISKDEEGNEIPLEAKMMGSFIEGAQKKIEGANFDRRKSVVEYDEVLRVQREIIYQQRKDVLYKDDMCEAVEKMALSYINRSVANYYSYDKKNVTFDYESFKKEFLYRFYDMNDIPQVDFESMSMQEVIDLLVESFEQKLKDRQTAYPDIFKEFIKVILLRVIDKYWMEHIDKMSSLRQNIGLQSYAQINPLREYQNSGYEMFETMMNNIETDVVVLVNRAQIRENLERKEVAKPTSTSSGKEEPTKRKPEVRTSKKIGRNDPCPCGSGKKYKKCCENKGS